MASFTGESASTEGQNLMLDKMSSNEKGALGENLVHNLCLKMGHRYRPQHEKSYGIDGLIELRCGGAEVGDFIFVEVKSGRGALSRESKLHYSVRVKLKHTTYWLDIGRPVILVWCDLQTEKAYWTPVVARSVNATGNIIKIPKSSRLGMHSTGELLSLCLKAYRPYSSLMILDFPDVPKATVNSIKSAAREYYDEWRAAPFYTPAHGLLAVTLCGWRHITSPSRSQNSVVQRLELLWAAKEILLTVATRKIVREEPENQTIYYLQSAIFRHRHRANAIVSVVVKEKTGHRPTFLSVFEQRTKKKEM